MIFGISAHSICLIYHFIDKPFVQHILANEPSNNFYKSDIPLARKSICWNILLPCLLTLCSNVF